MINCLNSIIDNLYSWNLYAQAPETLTTSYLEPKSLRPIREHVNQGLISTADLIKFGLNSYDILLIPPDHHPPTVNYQKLLFPQKMDVTTQIINLEFRLNIGRYFFCHSQNKQCKFILSSFIENEGYSFLIEEEYLEYVNFISRSQAYAWITCATKTELDYLGITAYISRKLALHGIPCNVIAAYHHDHIFVPYDQASRALHILNS